MSKVELFTLAGGIGLFLYGMTIMSTGLKNACGSKLRTILEHATKNKLISVLVGMVVTMLIQSSSATDMMVISFVNSGLMNLGQAIGVIMGANIGTTITAQITAFNISTYAPVILFVGAIMYLFFKRNMTKHIGCIILGFGMLFEGVALMKGAIAPLAALPAFSAFIASLDNPLVTVIFGVAFTSLLQSSSSSTVIFQAFAIEGLISFHTAAYLCIGAAIGSVTPNLLASLTTNRNGKRTALLNLLFNLFRAGLLMTLLALAPGLLDLIQRVSPDNVGRQIANTHTIFATVSVLAILPFANGIVKLTRIILPVTPDENRIVEERRLVFMGNADSISPAAALDQAHKEVARVGDIARNNLQMAINCFFQPDDAKAKVVLETEETVNFLEHAILSKLVELRTLDMHQQDLERLSHLTLAISDVERLSDHAENIVEYASLMHEGDVTLSDQAMKDLASMAELTMQSVDFCLNIFETQDEGRFAEAEALESKVDMAKDTLIQNHIDRLMTSACNPRGGVVFSDMVIDLERCSDHAINIAGLLSAESVRV